MSRRTPRVLACALATAIAASGSAYASPHDVQLALEPEDEIPTLLPVKLALPRLLLTGSVVDPAVAPVEGGRVASGFGYRRARVRRRRQFHAGLDFNAERGAPVRAARRGVVLNVALETDGDHGFLGYGNAVVVYHPESDDFSFYAHLDEVLVHVGQGLAAGQKLGRVGNSNNGKFRGMYPHLHFEVRRRASDGRSPFPGPYRANAVDPLAWLVEHGMERGCHGVVGIACRQGDPP